VSYLLQALGCFPRVSKGLTKRSNMDLEDCFPFVFLGQASHLNLNWRLAVSEVIPWPICLFAHSSEASVSQSYTLPQSDTWTGTVGVCQLHLSRFSCGDCSPLELTLLF
jgi:hypothetical protein